MLAEILLGTVIMANHVANYAEITQRVEYKGNPYILRNYNPTLTISSTTTGNDGRDIKIATNEFFESNSITDDIIIAKARIELFYGENHQQGQTVQVIAYFGDPEMDDTLAVGSVYQSDTIQHWTPILHLSRDEQGNIPVYVTINPVGGDYSALITLEIISSMSSANGENRRTRPVRK